MTTTKEDIRIWIERGKKNNYKYMIVFCDSFDNSDYPSYAKDINDFRIRMGTPLGRLNSMQRVMEVYDLSMDIEEQLNETRAHHPPCGY